MNNTKKTTTLAVAAILLAAILVVGAGTAGTVTTKTAFAASNNNNGNTVTIEECKNKGSASGFDTTVNQECENLICTHPGNNATCSQEGITSAPSIPIPTPTPTIQISGQGEGTNLCPFSATPRPASITFSAQQIGGTVQGQFHILVNSTESKTGTFNAIRQINGNQFEITGTELSSPCPRSQLPTTATIIVQCGTGVTIEYHTEDDEDATFTGDVACT